jgi:uncharacterized protein (TIGR02246 family)
MTRTCRRGLAAVVLVTACACAPKGDDASARAVAEKVTAEYKTAAEARDADGLAALFTPSGAGVWQGKPAVVGKDAVRAHYRAILETASAVEFEGTVLSAHGLGDVVAARGEWRTRVTPSRGGAAVDDGGGWSALYRRVGDAWKIEWLIATSERPERGRTADGADERALLQIEKDWAAALLKADTKALEAVLAPSWVTSFEGSVMTRPQLFAALRTGAARFDALEASEEEAFVFGDAAIVRGLVRIKGLEGGKPFDGKSRYTDLFVRRDGRWQAVVGHNTPVE